MFGLFGTDKKADKPEQQIGSAKSSIVATTAETLRNKAGITSTEETTAVMSMKINENETVSPRTNILMISNKRHRAFYERAARELMASGHDDIQLSALGDAVPLAVQLANCLQDKNAATVKKIETKLVEFPTDTQNNDGKKGNITPSRASGVTIIMYKHPDFKGTRIVPGYVFFCPDILTEGGQAFPLNPDRWMASVNAAPSGDAVFDLNGMGKQFSEILISAGHSIPAFTALHRFLLTEALRSNQDRTEMGKIRFVGELDAVRNLNSCLKAAFCRVCPQLKEQSDLGATGTVFVDVFAEANAPHGNEKNCCLVHVVAPKGSDFKNAKDFLAAVKLTANNLMNAICDFNGYAKRYQGDSKLPRLGVVRIPLISGDYRHPNTSSADVAKSLLDGLNLGYHFGPAPRLQFLDSKEGSLKKLWIEESGQPLDTVQITEATFIPSKV